MSDLGEALVSSRGGGGGGGGVPQVFSTLEGMVFKQFTLG